MKKFLNSIRINLETIGELFGYLVKRKLFWLIPILLILMILMVVILFGHNTGLAPFIYPIF